MDTNGVATVKGFAAASFGNAVIRKTSGRFVFRSASDPGCVVEMI